MPWGTDDSSGLLAHFIGRVDTAIWTTDSKRSDPNKPFGLWHVKVLDILQENFEGTPPETVPVTISIGAGWHEDEEGLTVEHEDGKEMFRTNSVMGKIIKTVLGSDSLGNNAVVKDGDGELLIDMSGVDKYMNNKGYDDPRHANIWEGLTFEFRGVGFRYRNDKSDDDVFQNVIPVKLISTDPSYGDDGNVEKPAGKKAQKAEPEPVDTVDVWQGAGSSSHEAEQLDVLVNANKNHAAFVREAMRLDFVKNSESLTAAVMDKANFPK